MYGIRLIVCVTFIIVNVVLAQSAEETQNSETLSNIKKPTSSPSPSPLAFTVGTLFSISTQAPIRNMMRREERFVRGLETLQRFVEKVENDMIERLRARTVPTKSDPLRPCNYPDQGYANAFSLFAELRGLPPLDTSCLTEYIGVRDNFTGEQLNTAFYNQTIPLYDNRFKIADVVLGNWTDADIPYDFTYNTTSQKCVVNSFAGMRQYDKWYFLTTLTNEFRFHNVESLKRQSISEYLRVYENGSLDEPLHLNVPERPDGNQPHVKNENTTTIITQWGGEAIPAHYRRIYPEQIPAVIESLEKSDSSVQQADDALVPSNLLILLLPLAFNLVPIAILAEVANEFMLFYTLLSDVITVVPLAIKGIELIQIGKRTEYGIATRLSGSLDRAIDGNRSDSAMVQVWIARCGVRGPVAQIGIAFVVLSFGFMIIGIVLEFLAHWYMKKRRMRAHLLAQNQEESFPSLQVIANEALVGASAPGRASPAWQSSMMIAEPGSPQARHLGLEPNSSRAPHLNYDDDDRERTVKKDLFRTRTRGIDDPNNF